MKIQYLLFIGLIWILVFGCSGRKSAQQPARDQDAADSIIVEEGIRYSGTDSLAKTLIIAYPGGNEDPRPAIIHFHGGGWRQGKASRGTAVRFAGEGFVGISIHYRLSPEAIFPAAVHDCKTAVRWARAHADRNIASGLRR